MKMDNLESACPKHSAGSTSQILQSFPKNEKFKGLNRNEKGFWYEIFNQTLFKINNIDSYGNSASYEEWLSKQIKGYDFRIRLPNGKIIKVEAKLTLKPIYHSWFMRDWLSRDADVYVTNDKFAVRYQDRRALDKQRKKLLSTTEFIMYLQKMRDSNKHSLKSTTETYNRYIQNTEKYSETKIDKWFSSENGMKNAEVDTENAKEAKLPACENCRNRNFCDILAELKVLEETKPKKELFQTKIDSLTYKPNHLNIVDFKTRRKEWLIKHGKLFVKQYNCLSKRIFLYTKKSYSLFDLED
jgi:hypothetical protein